MILTDVFVQVELADAKAASVVLGEIRDSNTITVQKCSSLALAINRAQRFREDQLDGEVGVRLVLFLEDPPMVETMSLEFAELIDLKKQWRRIMEAKRVRRRRARAAAMQVENGRSRA